MQHGLIWPVLLLGGYAAGFAIWFVQSLRAPRPALKDWCFQCTLALGGGALVAISGLGIFTAFYPAVRHAGNPSGFQTLAPAGTTNTLIAIAAALLLLGVISAVCGGWLSHLEAKRDEWLRSYGTS